MKPLHILLLWGMLVLTYACQSSTEPKGDFNLLPLPQSFEVTGESSFMPGDLLTYFALDGAELPACGTVVGKIEAAPDETRAQILFGIDESTGLKAEGYALEIAKQKISITARDKAGLLYAFMTLEQLLEDAQEQNVPLPLCTIRDFPLLSYRAIQLDMKHHLEKTDYYYKLMDQLARYKVNAVIAEVEDKLAYERQPDVGSEDALTMDEWKKLSAYAMERNIEISPLVQGLGHASFVLKHDTYKELRDDPKSDWAFNPLDPKTYEVQFDLYLDALEAMPHGRYLHVGGDEVHTTGRGSGKTELELQLTWLNKVCEFAAKHGRIPIFWDDMPIKYAGLYRPMFNTRYTREEVDSMWNENEHKMVKYLDMFPKNCIYMRWNYSSPQAEGNIKAMEWFADNGLPVMGATAGQTRWVLMPQNESNMENIRSFAMTSIEKGIDGLLLTLWDDDSPHFELYMRGILAFAEYSWTGDQRSKEEIKAAYRHREYANGLSGDEYAFVDQLEQMVAWWNTAFLQGNRRVSLAGMEDPVEEGIILMPSMDDKGAWTEKHKERLEMATRIVTSSEEIANTIESMKSVAIRNQFRLEIYEQVNELVRFSARTLLTLQAYDTAGGESEESEAFGKIGQLREEFKTLRGELEEVYGQTRILTKPDGYILDQDHHQHLANQTLSFDWQFTAELLLLEKIDTQFLSR